MIYWKEEYTYGLWIADNEEFNGFRSKLMEIMASVKQNSWNKQTRFQMLELSFNLLLVNFHAILIFIYFQIWKKNVVFSVFSTK